MSRNISTTIVLVTLTTFPAAVLAQGWGPPPPEAPMRAEEDEPQEAPPAPEDEAPPAAEDEEPDRPPLSQQVEPPVAEDTPVAVETPTPEEPTGEVEEALAAGAEGEEGEEPARDNWFRRMLKRIEFHGYARMPINFMFKPVPEGEGGTEGGGEEGASIRTRPPFLVSNDYYLSGFSYLRHHETDWSELFLTANLHDDVSITAGVFASLYSDWGYVSTETQFGLAQAYLTWRNIGGHEPLSLRVGVFWDKLGYIRPYDTYIFGRTHHWGLQLGYDFPCGAEIRIGGGGHMAITDQNQGFTPLIYAFGGLPIGPVRINAYVIGLWTNDVRPFTVIEEGHLVVAGADVEIDFPWFEGPLYLAVAYYNAERALFLANAFELMHSTGGRGLTENYFGITDSENGTGSMVVGGVNWPVNIWRGLYAHFYGMLAHVWSEQESDDPLVNRNDVTAIKWGLEVGYRILDWLGVGLVYDRVILDMDHPGRAFRALTPRIFFTPYENIEIELTYTHFFYGDCAGGDPWDPQCNSVRLRPNQVPGVTQPDEDVFHIMAEASW